jgi:chromosomal replication initiation ATPase DnaA
MNEMEYLIDRLSEVEIHYLIEKYDLDSKSREREKVTLRSELCARLRANTDLSFSQIGRLFNRDHSNVIHSCKVIDNYRKTNDYYYKQFMKEYRDELININYAPFKQIIYDK